MEIVWEFVKELVTSWVGAFLFLTGEVLLKIATLGRHRIRWWEVQDRNVTWATTTFGILFWLGAGATVWWFV